ncbi:MAG TPA: MMPL family transporter, partial [Tepidisphaeraceae bacterium]|nr:MMPL family transporter [Tepidisphaeraceae bacterium]
MSDDARPGFAARYWRILCIVFAVLISAAGWMRLRIDSSLIPLLPEDSDARRTVLFLRDSSFAAKAILWFRLTGNGTAADLYAAADAAEKMLDPNLITRVVHPPAASNAMDEALELMNDAPSLLNAGDFADLQQAITPDALRKRMRAIYMQLIEPAGSFMGQLSSRDPLGLDTRILSRLETLTNGLGFKVQIKDGRFVHTDGRQLMMILETSASATSLQSSKAIADNLEAIAAAAPPGVQIIPICAQIHTAENDALMERDIHRAAVINSIAFLLLFLLVSRDFRVAVVFLLPLATTVIAIGFCALVHPSLSTMMLGLAVSMAGSAVDYGIFVYTAVTLGSVSRAEVLKLWRPLVISHLTTLGVFIAFLFSRIPGFRELGWLTSISLILSLLAAIFMLPKMIRPGGRLALLGRGMPLTQWARQMAIPNYLLAMGFLTAGVFASGIGIDPDITRLDGASDAVKQAEIDFQKTWGRSDKQMAILVVNGRTQEAAAEANDDIYNLVAPHFADGGFASLSSFWPSQATQRANEARWRAFWTPERIGQFRADLTAA